MKESRIMKGQNDEWRDSQRYTIAQNRLRRIDPWKYGQTTVHRYLRGANLFSSSLSFPLS
jgi:hypothetical protein